MLFLNSNHSCQKSMLRFGFPTKMTMCWKSSWHALDLINQEPMSLGVRYNRETETMRLSNSIRFHLDLVGAAFGSSQGCRGQRRGVTVVFLSQGHVAHRHYSFLEPCGYTMKYQQGSMCRLRICLPVSRVFCISASCDTRGREPIAQQVGLYRCMVTALSCAFY